MRATGVAILAAGAFALSALTGCAPPPRLPDPVLGLRLDSTFTYQSLNAWRIAVGGLTSIADDTAQPPSTRLWSEMLLINSIRAAYPGIQVASAGAVAAEFGEKAHGELLDRYRRVGELDSASLHEMSARFPNLRYAVFARIDADVIDSAQTRTVDSDSLEQTLFSTRRTLTVGFHVYDLSVARSVWSGQIKQRARAYNTYDDGIGGGVVGAVIGLVNAIVEKREYPPPPEEPVVLGPIFDVFAKNLPKSPKP